MTTRITIVAATASLLGLTVAQAQLTGRQIMEEQKKRHELQFEQETVDMILTDKNGQTKERSMVSYSLKGEDGLSKVLLQFLAPRDIEGVGLLTWEQGEDKDDDQWLYLPALRKTKRIAAGDKSGSFMGSDFNYSDMSSPDLDKYDYTFMKEAKVRGNPVWQVKAVPKTKEEIEESGYWQSVLFIRQDNHVIVRAVHWVRKKKRNKYFDVKKLEIIDDIWVPTEMHMTTKAGKKTLHRTVIRKRNVRYNQDSVNEELFTIRRLEKGL